MKAYASGYKRHKRDNYYVVGEGILTYDREYQPTCDQHPGDVAELRKFRFSRMAPKGPLFPREAMLALAEAMTFAAGPDSANPAVPAGFTYLGQFVDHDLTMDRTAKALGSNVTLDELVQGRSPALDLDSLYGRGPNDPEDQKFYIDGARLRMGTTAAVPGGAAPSNIPLDTFDLPRVAQGGTKKERQAALIPDHRNDENLVVAQVHLAFIRFHNRVVDELASSGTPSADLFTTARDLVVKHYQWMLRTDYLPRIVDPAIVDDVFLNGRKFFEVGATPEHMPTMPLEFSVAAFRLGHSMIREQYEWNRFFNGKPGALAGGTLPLLFRFSGTSGNLSPDGDLNDPESGSFERLPSNWIADFRRLFDFTEVGRADLAAPEGAPNAARRIDTLLVDPLKALPLGSFGGDTQTPTAELNLAFRNLMRAVMVELATGQQVAAMMGVAPLTRAQLGGGSGGAKLEANSPVLDESPLWFYILREAELNGGKLGAVGGRIVAETFHRAMEGSAHSIVRDPSFRPNRLVQNPNDRFLMADLLLHAFGGNASLLNPLG